jgi:SAM-dependent methyltransferase
MGVGLSGWWTLLRLARQRTCSPAEYARFQRYQAGLVVDSLRSKGVLESPGRVLDLGCAHGGYGEALLASGLSVTSLDLNLSPVMSEGVRRSFVQADALSLPFPDTTFGLVFCANLLEHVALPLQLLAEVRRIVAPDGWIYVSFPPWYSPVGGHQFKPYHLLGERAALRLCNVPEVGYGTVYGNWGLYPRTIRGAKRMFGQIGLAIEHQGTRFMPVDFSRIPILGELLTWHIEFLLCRAHSV